MSFTKILGTSLSGVKIYRIVKDFIEDQFFCLVCEQKFSGEPALIYHDLSSPHPKQIEDMLSEDTSKFKDANYDVHQKGGIVYNKNEPVSALYDGQQCTIYYEGYCINSKRPVYVKVLRIVDTSAERVETEKDALVRTEKSSTATMYIVKLLASAEDSEYFYLAYEQCLGSLSCLLSVQDAILDMKRVLRGAIFGLSAIHKTDIHRNIRPHNIMIYENSVGKVSNLLMSKFIDSEKSLQSVSCEDYLLCQYSAPEIETKGISKSADIFSMGCVYYFPITGRHLFPAFKKSTEKLDLTLLDDRKMFLLKDLVNKMVAKNPKKRPTALKVLNHPFFWEDDKIKNFFIVGCGYIQPLLKKKDNEEDLMIKAEFEQYFEKAETVGWESQILKEIKDNLIDIAGKRHPYDNTVKSFVRALHNSMKHHTTDGDCEGIRNACASKGGVVQCWMQSFPRLLIEMYDACSNFSTRPEFNEFYCEADPNRLTL